MSSRLWRYSLRIYFACLARAAFIPFLEYLMKSKIILFLITISLTASCGLLERGGRKYNIEVKSTVEGFENVEGEAVNVFRARLNSAGVRNNTTKKGDGRVEVIALGQFDADRIRNLLLTPGKLELAKVITGDTFQTYSTLEAALESMGGSVPPNRRILPYAERADISGKAEVSVRWIIVEKPSVIDGRAIREASAFSASDAVNGYQINFQLNPEGAKAFGDWTARNIGNYLAIILNDEVKSAPVIKGQIFDTGQIDGRFTKESADDLALILKSGYLPAKLTLIDETPFE